MMEAPGKGEYGRVLPLLEGGTPNYFDIVARAVIAGNSPGTIWVDDTGTPKSALIHDKGYCYYLAGEPNNADYDHALESLISGQIAPEAIAAGHPVFKLYYTSTGWESRAEDIFGAATLDRRERAYFTLERPMV